jgi:hypothetical protein
MSTPMRYRPSVKGPAAPPLEGASDATEFAAAGAADSVTVTVTGAAETVSVAAVVTVERVTAVVVAVTVVAAAAPPDGAQAVTTPITRIADATAVELETSRLFVAMNLIWLPSTLAAPAHGTRFPLMGIIDH